MVVEEMSTQGNVEETAKSAEPTEDTSNDNCKEKDLLLDDTTYSRSRGLLLIFTVVCLYVLLLVLLNTHSLQFEKLHRLEDIAMRTEKMLAKVHNNEMVLRENIDSAFLQLDGDIIYTDPSENNTLLVEEFLEEIVGIED